jgi:tryptophan halogenase
MKIVIVGGGTAAWISAAFLLKECPHYDITIVESSKIPIIGAGEGSVGSMSWLLRMKWPNDWVNQHDFMKAVKGTPKMGIRLQNWKGDGSYIYSPIKSSPSSKSAPDIGFLSAIMKYGPGHSDKSAFHSFMMDNRLVPFFKDRMSRPYGEGNHTYHFDGHEVGKYFKNFCVRMGAKVIDSEVNEVNFDENEFVKDILLATGETLEGDLFIDCTGFSKVLMGKTKNKWLSFKDNLPTNSVIPFSDDIFSKTVRFETLAEALDAGWMWKIPLQNRYGCGYVYSDNFKTYDEALRELEIKFKKNITPIKHIKFEAGRYEQNWYNNILAVGLSSHFLEPLQATNIHMSILSISNLVTTHLKTKASLKCPANRKQFNDDLGKVIDNYRDLLQIHYLSGREDTEFWRTIKNELKITDGNQHLLEISKTRSLSFFDVSTQHGAAGWPVWCHILDMAGFFKKELIEEELIAYNRIGEIQKETSFMTNYYAKDLKPILATADDFFKYLKA